MNKKKIFVPLIIAIIIMGIGYAALNTSLSVTGSASATADDSNFKVVFNKDVEATATTETSGATVSASYTSDTEASISVSGLTTAGQTATFTYSIINKSTDLDANLALGDITKTLTGESGSADYFTVNASLNSNTIAKGGTNTATLTITVTLNTTPVDDLAVNITVPFTATASV